MTAPFHGIVDGLIDLFVVMIDRIPAERMVGLAAWYP
jgi:hypothetical protein